MQSPKFYKPLFESFSLLPPLKARTQPYLFCAVHIPLNYECLWWAVFLFINTVPNIMLRIQSTQTTPGHCEIKDMSPKSLNVSGPAVLDHSKSNQIQMPMGAFLPFIHHSSPYWQPSTVTKTVYLEIEIHSKSKISMDNILLLFWGRGSGVGSE